MKETHAMELMKEIPTLIKDLLPAHGCVIIPGLGGFITHYKPAYIQASSGKIMPPTAEIGFNPALRTNDGLLAGFLARKSGLAYNASLEKVQEFSWACLADLNIGKEVYFKGLGTLKLDEYKNFRFEPDRQANLLDDAFGLTQVNALPLKHPTPPIQRKDRKPERKSLQRKHVVEGLRWTVMIMPLLLLAFYSVYQTGVLEGLVSYSSFSGISVSQSQESLKPENIPSQDPLQEQYFAGVQWPASLATEPEPVPADTTLPVIVFKSDITAQPQGKKSAGLPSTEKTPPTVQAKESLVNLEPETSIQASSTTSDIHGKYHLIIGCFKNLDNATRIITELRQKGIEAFKAGSTPSGLIRVSVGGYASLTEATQARNDLAQKDITGLWISKL
ncbi:MAG: SPOR domain-containing protein [Bacteroidales bacterium]